MLLSKEGLPLDLKIKFNFALPYQTYGQNQALSLVSVSNETLTTMGRKSVSPFYISFFGKFSNLRAIVFENKIRVFQTDVRRVVYPAQLGCIALIR